MCGINLLWNDKIDYEYFDRLSHRGEDSFGVFGVTTKNKLYSYKDTLSEFRFKTKTQKLKFKWAIIHNRKASIGKAEDISIAHPVKVGKNVFVIHNGTNKNLYYTHRKAKSDTHAIGLIYSQLAKKTSIFDYLDDIGVVFIIDTKTNLIYFHKDKSRTLYVNPDLKIMASEPIDVGRWRLIASMDKVFTFEEWNSWLNVFSKLSLKEKEISITQPTFDVCPVCGEVKLTDESFKGKCPNCFYLDKKVEKWTGYTSDDIYTTYGYKGGYRWI